MPDAHHILYEYQANLHRVVRQGINEPVALLNLLQTNVQRKCRWYDLQELDNQVRNIYPIAEQHYSVLRSELCFQLHLVSLKITRPSALKF